ncbi:MAG TPA: sulfotransferase, partial [Thermoanaerobaculia bacterium]|nr:sulfotransferase [Thermoanaerobaculia bacterium]
MGDSALIGSGGTRSGTGDGSSAESAAFVLCIEGNETRDQALLLIESIRAFGGGLAASEILAVAPRQGLGVDADTRARLEALGASYHEEPLNRVCPEYGSANRVYAAAWAAEVCDAEVLFVLDSDTLVLGEPEPLGTACDLAVRPVDVKGSTTTGAGDPFDGYWRSLCELASASIDALPFVATVFDGLRVRASYNGGYSVVRRSSGILQRTAELFTRSVAADLRPHEGHSGHRLFASTGYVSDRANEYWGSVQAALSIAAWSTTRRVRLLGRRYNVPLHMLADAAHWTEDWRDLHPLHVHYHWMLRAADRARGLRTLAMIGVPWDQLQWLAARAGRPEGRRAAVPARATQRCRQVVICGMHRTGTSLVASVLRQAGIDIGRELNPGGRGNLRGHFEDEAVHRLHEEMLAAAGYTCLTAGGDLSREVRSGFEERARTFIANRADRPLWGWKDPRTCLFFEFWDRLLPAAGYVMLYRHPLDVALSLWRRGTEPELRLDPWLAIHAYEVYNRLLLDFRRRHPERCVLAQVPALTADLSGFVALAADKLDLA